MNEWKPVHDIDFNDDTIKSYHIDTRDFCCMCSGEDNSHLFDIEKLRNSKHSKFFHDSKEVKQLLDRYFTESGGKGDWRMLNLKGPNCSPDWSMKYIRIYRTAYGFVICNKDNYALNKDILSCPIDQEYLHHQ